MKAVCLRSTNYETLLEKLELLGIEIRRELPVEYHIGRCSTPPLETLTGTAVTIWLHDPEYAKLPEITGPDFLVDWTDQDYVEVEVDGAIVQEPLPWPDYDVEIDGESGAEIIRMPARMIV